MPALFSFLSPPPVRRAPPVSSPQRRGRAPRQHPALEEVSPLPGNSEKISSFRHDIYVVCHPERAGEIVSLLANALDRRARISVNLGKTKPGAEPSGLDHVGTVQAPAWVGDPMLPPSKKPDKLPVWCGSRTSASGDGLAESTCPRLPEQLPTALRRVAANRAVSDGGKDRG
jgi:hypothetical protein